MGSVPSKACFVALADKNSLELLRHIRIRALGVDLRLATTQSFSKAQALRYIRSQCDAIVARDRRHLRLS